MDDLSLTLATHLEPDCRLKFFTVDGLGRGSLAPDQWIQAFLQVQIEVSISAFLSDLFERARACMVYGCYHYPLFTLGLEEVWRFNESALREALKEAGGSKRSQQAKYVDLIEWAASNGFLTPEDRKRWHAGRELRNRTSHKSKPLLVTPNEALGSLSLSVELVESVFRNVRRASGRS